MQSEYRYLYSNRLIENPFYSLMLQKVAVISIEAVLKQIQPDNKLHPVGYFSRRLKPFEISNSPTELELLAIVNAVSYWKHYLYKQKFTVITDHSSVIYLNNFKNKSDKLTRWKALLRKYNFDIYYRKGRENVEADCLPRVPN